MSKAIFAKCCLNPLMRMANTPWVLAVGVLGSLVFFGGLFVLFEGLGPLDSIYWASTTMTSVGYGDLSPATSAGKVMTIVFQLWSMFVLLPCAIANIVDAVRVDPKSFSHAEQEYLMKYIEMDAERKGFGLGPQPEDY